MLLILLLQFGRLYKMELQTIAKIFINPLVYFFLLTFLLIAKPTLKLRKKLFLLFILYFFSIPLSSNILLNIWSKKDKINKTKTYDAILVLAGGLDFQWHIKKMVINDLKLDYESFSKFTGAEERIFTAIEMVKKGYARKIFYSNWQPSFTVKDSTIKYNCSQKIKDFVFKMGISKSRFIIYGNEVRRTKDEANEFQKYINYNSGNNILLITSQSHMRRALGIFNNKNIILDHFSVSKVDSIFENIFNIKYYIPNLNGLKGLRGFLYEFIGYLGYFILGDI